MAQIRYPARELPHAVGAAKKRKEKKRKKKKDAVEDSMRLNTVIHRLALGSRFLISRGGSVLFYTCEVMCIIKMLFMCKYDIWSSESVGKGS